MLSAEGLTVQRGQRTVLAGLGLHVAVGEVVAIVGVSGSGKSSLLHCLAGLLKPKGGQVRVDDTVVSEGKAARRAAWRLRHCGLVFQFGELLPELTLRENVELPLRMLGYGGNHVTARAADLLERVGIGEVADQVPGDVSGGQMQRAAVARAVVHKPAVLLADEPTGALDAKTSTAVADVLVHTARESGCMSVIVTHNTDLAAIADRRLTLVDGRLTAEANA